MKRIINFRSSRTRMFLLALVDIVLVVVNMYLSLIMRYEFQYDAIRYEHIASVQRYMLVNIVTTIVIFWIMKLYRSVWTFASTHELLLIGGASVAVTALQALGMQFLQLKVPRSYYIFFFGMMLLTTVGSRFSYRALRIFEQ